MKCDVEYTDEFGAFWKTLSEDEQEDIAAIIGLLEEKGTELPFPFSTGVEGSKHSHMRELRVQSKSNPLRILYAFDPRRAAILLIGGNKRGDKRWYKTYIPIADKLYTDHLVELKKEGLL
ncbi:MAG: type II toxin-antitoxin system RelE/ParE family toxin [Alphaproteobacteria bacterium]|jgi:hypothetical protein|nr:type II toxin-antitoxin system RelE/ParE family toxin [Alphaproteobacteria bacterium]